MELKNHVAESELYDVYETDGMAVRLYKKPEHKEKCLYAALTHARVETTLLHASIKMPVLHDVSVIDGKWSITMDWIKGKTLAELIEENPDKAEYRVEENGNLVNVTIVLDEEDMGKVIGKQGRIAKAIRTVMRAVATRNDQKIMVEID